MTIAEPDLVGVRVRPEIVDMPMRPSGRFQVMPHSGFESTGTVGAADVDTESGLEVERSELADCYGSSFGR
jgi:hypothetical protein